MALAPWGEYRPDVSDLDQGISQNILNVLPRGDGYGPFPSAQAFTSALAGQCRGYFCARKTTDNTVVIFACTSTRIYKLDNTLLTWTDVSKGGSAYTPVNTDANWTFAQFNNTVIACQANTAPQKFDITSASAFSDVSGSPPQAAYVTVINRFAVLSGLTSNPNRVQWSGLNDITNWTSGTGSSDYQDLPDGGIVRGVVGGELGVIIQDAAIRTMTFSPGSDVIFNIFKVAKDVGTIAPYSITQDGNRIFFLSAKGWVQTDTSGSLNYIGQERVDRTFLSSYDTSTPQLIFGAADPKLPVVYFVYRQSGSSVTYADKGLAYNWLIQRWTPFTAAYEFIASTSRPGLTLEGLDALAPGAIAISGAANNGSGLVRLTVSSTSGWTTGDKKTVTQVGGTTEANGTWTITVIDGTHIDLQGSTFASAYTSGGYVGGSVDLMTTSFDQISSSATNAISVVDSSHKIGFLSGSNSEATLETAEVSGDGSRILVNGFWPICDAATVYGSVGYRENLNASRSYTTEVTMNSYGFVPTLRSTRYARGKIRIPSGTTWTFSSGVRPETQADGMA